MRLIDNWKKAHKLWSARLAGALAALAGADWLLPSLADTIPKWAYVLLAIGILVARVTKQKEVGDGRDQ